MPGCREPTPEIPPGGSAEAVFGLNAYRGEPSPPKPPGHYLFIKTLGTKVH